MLAATASAQSARDMRITGIDLRVTSGTLQLNHITSAEAYMGEDLRTVITEEIKLEARTTDERRVIASSEQGIVTISGDRP